MKYKVLTIPREAAPQTVKVTAMRKTKHGYALAFEITSCPKGEAEKLKRKLES